MTELKKQIQKAFRQEEKDIGSDLPSGMIWYEDNKYRLILERTNN